MCGTSVCTVLESEVKNEFYHQCWINNTRKVGIMGIFFKVNVTLWVMHV